MAGAKGRGLVNGKKAKKPSERPISAWTYGTESESALEECRRLSEHPQGRLM
jgi:hypothetical protein